MINESNTSSLSITFSIIVFFISSSISPSRISSPNITTEFNKLTISSPVIIPDSITASGTIIAAFSPSE